ncbi:MAG: glycosyltransferase family 39 protein, partial [Caldilineaceae bacterium]
MAQTGGMAQRGEPAAKGASGVDALWIVGGLALAHLLIHLALNSRYDLHRDEMAVVDYARRLDWGFVEFPPLTPALVRLSMVIFGESVWGARVLAALAMALVVLLAGLMARDLGGGRGAQVLAAAGAFASLFGMLMGSMTLYAAFDFLWWVAVVWALVRRRSSNNPRWWLAVGLLIGLGVMTKYTMVILGAAVFVAVLLSDLRRDLRTPWPWLAAGLALLLVAPNLLWQSRHGWVAIEFTQAIHARDVAWGRSEGFWIEQLYANASPVTLPLWLAGLGWLVFAKEARPWRFL